VDVDDLRNRVQALGWFHSIDLGNGVVTPGLGVADYLTSGELPDFEDRTVLDIGAWDGYYSFLAERHGASHVTALDHYVWGVNLGQRQAYWAECASRGELPDHSRDTVEFWDPTLPGQRGFQFAKEVLDSKVEPVVADFMSVDLEALGTFDIVLYLGVLYHMKEPLTALERLRHVTREVAVVETEAINVVGYEDHELVRFLAGNEVNLDFGNWYVPSLPALRAMCRAAGFARVETVRGPPGVETRRTQHIVNSLRRPDQSVNSYRAVVQAFV